MLEEVARAHGEGFGIPVFGAGRDLDFLQLFLQSAGGVAEGAQGTLDDPDLVVVDPAGGVVAQRGRRHEELVEVEHDGYFVVFVDTVCVASADAEVGGQELLIVVVVGVGELGTEVGDEGAEGEVLGFVDGLLVIEADVGGKRVGSLGGGVAAAVADGLAVGEVGAQEASGGTEGEVVVELQGIGNIEGELVGVHGLDFVALHVGVVDVAEGEVGEAGGGGAAVVDAIVACEVEEVHVAHLQFAQPGGVGGVDACDAVDEGQFGVVPMGGIGVGRGGHAYVAHTAGDGVGGNEDDGQAGRYEILFLTEFGILGAERSAQGHKHC